MTRDEIIAKISKATNLEKQIVLQIIESFTETVKGSLVINKPIYLRGFGSFVVKHRAEKKARNISKNSTIIIPAHNVPVFKPASKFVDSIRKK